MTGKRKKDSEIKAQCYSNHNEDDVPMLSSHHKTEVGSFRNSTKGELVDLCNRFKLNYIDVPATDRRMDMLNYTNNDNAMMIESDDMIRVTFEDASFREKPSNRNPLVPTLDELRFGIIRYCKEHDHICLESKVMNQMKDHARITANNRIREKRRRSALPAKLIDTRRLMELFCISLLRRYNITYYTVTNSLFHMIQLLENSGIVCRKLTASMHKVRCLANIAVHNIDDLPQTEVIDRTLSLYIYWRRFYFNDLERF